MPVDKAAIEFAVRTILKAIGEDPTREGLLETPARVARWWSEFIDYDPGKMHTAFECKYDEMIIVSGIQVWSLCEHHLLPFKAEVAIGYLPGERVLGLSKLIRIAKKYAHALQLQERMTDNIAQAVGGFARTEHVGVVVRGEHLCAQMRGVESPNSVMTTSSMYGAFRESARVRAEFLELVREKGRS